MDADCDLFERFVRAASTGSLRLPDENQLLSLDPGAPELAHALQDFCKAIAKFVSIVAENRDPGPGPDLERTEVAVGNVPDRTDLVSNQDLQRPTTSTESVERLPTPCDDGIEITYRIRDGVVTLLPKNMQECRDLPFLAEQACKVNATETGVFKYILSTDCGGGVSSGQATSAWSFSSARSDTGRTCLTYHQHSESVTVVPTDPLETEPQILAAELENIVSDFQQLSKMRYCTDLPAQTEEQRRACGLPLRSPIYPLPHNQLDKTLYEVDGLHSPYGYLGTGFFTSHREDQNTWSINVLHKGGPVLWLTVDPKYAPVLEGLESRWSCDQKLRHERWYFTTSELERLGVSYQLFLQYPGEAVVLFGKTYHQGGNIGSKVAEAVNYAPPSWTVEGYKECRRGSRGCPGYPIPNAYLRFLQPGEAQRRQSDDTGHEPEEDIASQKHPNQKAITQMPAKLSRRAVLKPPEKRKSDRSHLPNTTKRRRSPDPNPALTQMVQYLQKLDPFCVIPPYDPPVSPSVLKLVAAILSRPAIVSFCNLVQSRRHTETPLSCWVADDGDERQLELRLHNLGRIQAQSHLDKFIVRIHEFELARHMEHKRKGRIRNDPQDIKNIVKRSGWDYQKFRRHESRGRKWLELFKTHPGLLCFLLVDDHLPFEVSCTDYIDMSATDISTFRALLACEYANRLNAIGAKFIESLSPLAEDVEFRWEAEKVCWQKLSPLEALECLSPITWEVDNIYSPEKYPGWERPPDWPTYKEWPTNPMVILNHPQCELCPQTQCSCYTTKFARAESVQPRIKNYADKGRGIRAVAGVPGQVAYVEGEYIGVLSGEIVPTGTHHGTMIMDFNHPDILCEPVVCQIDFAKRGPCLRLSNHSCRPSARVKAMKVSGQYRLIMTAARDIYDAEEITVDFKRSSLDGPCLCGARRCRERVTEARTSTDR
ncbi:uncharacterized protein HMPREF1541_10437 [Cyphellophora europaea CBS 101466]|uniref:JmjC domain-containing protein n=1 Tax=Cyphellophora europaea (strain CBS 101466) TaxID=1220924 RepID=W2S7W7_CYPE1|nr:uncharacterized protein HMPREF1541_10437 [Cyphellophora europaea CBS 101466]ETN44767.1 hypothetical protein HMPREF1541_10437 [Cyphellophora europaea CBS 101466]